jgi:rhodanese-related sulfurtransferase
MILIVYMINVKTMTMLALVALIAILCATCLAKRNSNSGPVAMLTDYSTVNVEEFQNQIADPLVQLLDVRTPEEFDEGHIAGAVLVDANEGDFLEKAMAVLDITRPVAVYCRSGRRSARASSWLSAKGYKVTNLDGGVIAWQDAGKSLVK